MKKILALFNALVLCFTLFMNYYVNTGAVNDRTIGEVSDMYYNLFTPADYAFSIWGLIFIGLIVLTVAQLKEAFFGSENDHKIMETVPWLIFANLANALWTYVWLQLWASLSVFLMLIILLALIRIIQELDLQLRPAPRSVRITIYWPLGLYAGWIAVATIANISAFLTVLQIDLWLHDRLWTAAMILVATVLNLYMVQKRRMVSFGLMGIWALVAISMRHWNEMPMLSWLSLVSAAVLLATIFLGKTERNGGLVDIQEG